MTPGLATRVRALELIHMTATKRTVAVYVPLVFSCLSSWTFSLQSQCQTNVYAGEVEKQENSGKKASIFLIMVKGCLI